MVVTPHAAFYSTAATRGERPLAPVGQRKLDGRAPRAPNALSERAGGLACSQAPPELVGTANDRHRWPRLPPGLTVRHRLDKH